MQIGADICGLPSDSPVHMQGATMGHEFKPPWTPSLTKEAVHKFYAKTGPFPFSYQYQYQYQVQAAAYAAALTPVQRAIIAVECTCAAKHGVIGHASFCPLGPESDDGKV